MSHKWNDEKTEWFVCAMEELVVEGQRAYAGQFKLGSFEKLSKKMLEKFPTSCITAQHCKNKPKRLKEKYQSAADMVACSGFGWRDGLQCEVVDSKEILDQHIKESDLPMEDDDTDMLNLEGQDSDSQFESQLIGSSSGVKRARPNSTKRTRGEDAMIILAESMQTVVGEQGKHIQVLANTLSGVNKEVNIGRTLNKLGFSTENIVAISLKFGQQPQLKDIFWSLEDV
ncbi:hypothetical protein PIB30_056208 [Stylosanthes scabra]|uniref:Myb/SANT-like domain-containing protein n=1 Tax=Stylosanthes scabra TaxID=79078 RepID=A0ABU6ZI17_9FABA|nr:hypothetical protein [Stylosanthes scabra]